MTRLATPLVGRSLDILFVFPEDRYTMKTHAKMPKRWSYFFEIATYVRDQGHRVKMMDCIDPRISHGEILSELSRKHYDLIIMVARFENTRGIFHLAPLMKEIAPDTPQLVYGDVPSFAPRFYQQIDALDGIAHIGDFEPAIMNYIDYMQGGRSAADTLGVCVRDDGKWVLATQGEALKDESWSFPDLEDADFAKTARNYMACTKNEVTVSVSRGCPFNCHFCPAVVTFHTKDRRKHYREIADYMIANADRVSTFKLFSPTFTLVPTWVKEFGQYLIDNKSKAKWCCTSNENCLQDDEMIDIMAASGCYKVAIGVETLDPESNQHLGKFGNYDRHIRFVEKCFTKITSLGVQAKPLLMLGIQGQTRDNVRQSLRWLKQWGGSGLRATSYSPRGELPGLDERGELTLELLEQYDKMTYQHSEITNVTRAEFLKLLYNAGDFENILSDPPEPSYGCHSEESCISAAM